MVAGGGVLEELAASRRPVVFSFWHNRVLFCSYTLYRRLLRKGYPITVLVSHSGDGALGARLAELWGAQVVRGSTSRGGSIGLRKMYRAVRGGSAAVTIPDGPRGPLYRVQPGAVVLAQMTQVPILPMAFSADRYWAIRSWDRLIVPKPFARIRLAVGEPMEIPRELSESDLEAQKHRLEETLNELVRRVEAPVQPPMKDSVET